MTAYTKYPVGNKLFVIEWQLSVVGGVENTGDTFEAFDAVPVSLCAISDTGILVRLQFGNLSNALNQMNISGELFLPSGPGFAPGLTPNPELPPPVRFYKAIAENGSGAARVAVLFREL